MFPIVGGVKVSKFSSYNTYLGIMDHALGGGLKVKSDEDLKRMSINFALIMTDIALNPDIPADIEDDLFKIDWEDFNPAWRFVKLQDIIINEKISEKKDVDAQDLLNIFLDKTGWVSPYEAISRQLIYANDWRNCLPMDLISKLLCYRKNAGSPFLDWFYGGDKSEIAKIIAPKTLLINADINKTAKEMIKLMYG